MIADGKFSRMPTHDCYKEPTCKKMNSWAPAVSARNTIGLSLENLNIHIQAKLSSQHHYLIVITSG